MMTRIGVVRRVRALAAMGHPDVDVAQWLDIPVSEVSGLQAEGTQDAALCAVLDAVFAQQADQVGRCAATRARARKEGWRTAMAYPDGALDQQGETVTFPRFDTGYAVAEQAGDALIRTLASQGWTDAEIGRHLRIDRNAIQRRRTALGIAAGRTHRQFRVS